MNDQDNKQNALCQNIRLAISVTEARTPDIWGIISALSPLNCSRLHSYFGTHFSILKTCLQSLTLGLVGRLFCTLYIPKDRVMTAEKLLGQVVNPDERAQVSLVLR